MPDLCPQADTLFQTFPYLPLETSCPGLTQATCEGSSLLTFGTALSSSHRALAAPVVLKTNGSDAAESHLCIFIPHLVTVLCCAFLAAFEQLSTHPNTFHCFIYLFNT